MDQQLHGVFGCDNCKLSIIIIIKNVSVSLSAFWNVCVLKKIWKIFEITWLVFNEKSVMSVFEIMFYGLLIKVPKSMEIGSAV